MTTPTARTRAESRLTVVMLGGLVAALVIGAGPATESRGQPVPLATALRRAAAGLMGPAGPVSRFRQRMGPDEWVRLIDAGDALSTGGAPVARDGVLLTARTAYLLAFHHAQDVADASRMLTAAERLEAVGEHDLAHHARARALGLPPGAGAAPRPPR